MTTNRKVLQLMFSGGAGWLILVGLVAVWIFSSSKEPPELGDVGFFFVWTIVLACFYLVDFLLIAIVFYPVLRHRFRPVRLWLHSLIGAALFAIAVPLWFLTAGHLKADDIILHMDIASVVGFVCFFIPGCYEKKHGEYQD